MSANPQKDWLPPLMNEWAEFINSIEDGSLGFSSSNTLYRAMMAQTGGEFGSKLPLGLTALEINGELRKIVHAIRRLDEVTDEAISQPVAITKSFYRYGAEPTQEQYGLKMGKMYAAVKIGEGIIRTEMRYS